MAESTINMDRFTLDDLLAVRPTLTGLKGWQRAPLVVEQPKLAGYLLSEVVRGNSELAPGNTTAEVPVPIMRHFLHLIEGQEDMDQFCEDSVELGMAVAMARVGNVILGQTRTLGRNQGGCILPGAIRGHQVMAQTYESAAYARDVFRGAEYATVYIGHTLTEHLAVA